MRQITEDSASNVPSSIQRVAELLEGEELDEVCREIEQIRAAGDSPGARRMLEIVDMISGHVAANQIAAATDRVPGLSSIVEQIIHQLEQRRTE